MRPARNSKFDYNKKQTANGYSSRRKTDNIGINTADGYRYE